MNATWVKCIGMVIVTVGLVSLGRPASGQPDPIPVWIDTDPSVAPGGHEVDDGFALVQAFRSAELDIRGVSVVFGNTALDKAYPIAEEFMALLDGSDLTVAPGAAGAQDLGTETAASRALAEALRETRLTLLVLGPVTNVATVLKNHPELGRNVEALVAVAGRRPGQRFLTKQDGQPHRDYNFELDAEGFQILLDSGVPLVLAPWEVSSKVWLAEVDVAQLRRGRPEARWLYRPSMDWLERWKTLFDKAAFNPYDTLAVGYVTSPELIECEELPAAIRTLPNDRLAFAPSEPAEKPHLLAGFDVESDRTVRYCFNPSPAFKADLMRRLLAQ